MLMQFNDALGQEVNCPERLFKLSEESVITLAPLPWLLALCALSAYMIQQPMVYSFGDIHQATMYINATSSEDEPLPHGRYPGFVIQGAKPRNMHS